MKKIIPFLIVGLLSSLVSTQAKELENKWVKEVGVDFRYRIIQEDSRKLSSTEIGNHRLWQRFRLRGWTSITPLPSMEFNLRFVTEPRYYNDGSWVRDEFMFDNFNLTLRQPFDVPLVATLGRQQIKLANGWLVGEGTPLDGTRTAYFDAVRTQFTMEDWRSSLDLMWINNRRDSSAYLSPVNDYDFDMIEQDESGVVAYLGFETIDQLFIDPYFIYKKDHNPGAKGVTGETYTFGLRGHGKATETLDVNAEVAPQFGHKNGKEVSAVAANLWAEQLFNDAKKASIRLGYEYLSGNRDPELHFDRLWGREGHWSDLYTGGVDGFDGRELDSSNLHRPHAILAFSPYKSLRFFAEYSLLFADTYIDNPDPGKIDNGSRFKGHHIKSALEHQLTKNLKHYVTVQAMLPGDYYSSERTDTATWLRYSVEVKW